MNEKRVNARRKSVNFLSYVLINPLGDGFGQGLGRTLNLSKGGALLEVNQAFAPGDLIELTLCHEQRLLVLKGRVIYCRPSSPQTFESGIRFLGTNEQEYQFLTQFIKTFTVQAEKRRTSGGIQARMKKLDNVADLMAHEHRVIVDYVIGFKHLSASEPKDLLPQALKTLLSFMKRDVKRHFELEEEVFFPAALTLDSAQIRGTVEQLKNEHHAILQELTAALDQAAHGEDGWWQDAALLERLQAMFDLLKGHSQKEIFDLYQEMDHHPGIYDKIRQLTTT